MAKWNTRVFIQKIKLWTLDPLNTCKITKGEIGSVRNMEMFNFWGINNNRHEISSYQTFIPTPSFLYLDKSTGPILSFVALPH